MPPIVDPIVDPNPFFQAPSQANRYRAQCQISVAGIDVTGNLDPFLISVRVYNGEPLTAEVELDDRDARIPIPPLGEDLVIALGWASEAMYVVFRGKIQDVEHGFDRKRGGRRMWVHGQGMATGQQLGQPIPFVAAAQQFAGNGGAVAAVGPSLMGTMNDFWSMNGESPLEWFTRQSEEQGAQRCSGGAP
jgi:hypothetical protein